VRTTQRYERGREADHRRDPAKAQSLRRPIRNCRS
jgi:hypothetical protein